MVDSIVGEDAVPENVENLILEHLKKIQAEQSAARERDREIISRMSGLEAAIASLKRDGAEMYAGQISMTARLDRVSERIERIEKRLELSSS